jgi:calcium-dependent protein kinase
MFVSDPKQRISASKALKEPWITNFSEEVKVTTADLRISLRKLCCYKTQLSFQDAVVSYIASQTLSKSEEEKIRQVFVVFDSDKDGKLTKKDLMSSLKFMYGNERTAKKYASQIFGNLDKNKTGAIEYNRNLY